MKAHDQFEDSNFHNKDEKSTELQYEQNVAVFKVGQYFYISFVTRIIYVLTPLHNNNDP